MMQLVIASGTRTATWSILGFFNFCGSLSQVTSPPAWSSRRMISRGVSQSVEPPTSIKPPCKSWTAADEPIGMGRSGPRTHNLAFSWRISTALVAKSSLCSSLAPGAAVKPPATMIDFLVLVLSVLICPHPGDTLGSVL